MQSNRADELPSIVDDDLEFGKLFFKVCNGFLAANESDFTNMPSIWDRAASSWLTLKLKDEEALASLDKEFALFVESEKRNSADVLTKAKMLKTAFITLITLAALAFGVAMIWLLIKRGGLTPH